MNNFSPNRPEPIITDLDVIGYNKSMSTEYAVEALIEGYYVLVLDYFSSGLEILRVLKTQLKKQYSSNSYKTEREFRSKYRELSHRLLLEISDDTLSVERAPYIGWFKILYSDLEEFLLPFPQIQGLNSSWQWYKKGLFIPVIEKKIYPWFDTYFPTRFEHLELFDEFLNEYSDEKQTAIDIGIGSGVLTLQMLKYGFDSVIGIDTNPNAIIGLNEYLSKESLESKVKRHYGNLFSGINEKADLIVFNPPWLPINKNVEGIDQAMYYDKELFPRFFEQANKYLKPNGKLILIFSNLAQITHLIKSHPIEDELANAQRFKKELLLKKKVGVSSKNTKRELSRRSLEEVELWVLNSVNQ